MDPIKLHQDLRNNQEDIQSYMRDLRNWTDQIKKKDKELSSKSKTEPPTERTLGFKRGGDSKRPVAPKPTTESAEDQRKKMAKKYEPSEEVLRLKEAGNECLKNQKYEEAIKHYSAAMALDSNYHILPANRGMAYLKQNSFKKAEQDCGKAVSLDPTYIKGYLRRGTARLELGKLQLAREDYQKVLQLEPHNPQAKMSLERIRLEEAKRARLKAAQKKTDQLASQNTSVQTPGATTDPSKVSEKPAHLRSQKPLKKISAVQVRNDEELERFIESGGVSRPEHCFESDTKGSAKLPFVTSEEKQEATEKRPNDKQGSPLQKRQGGDSTEEASNGGQKVIPDLVSTAQTVTASSMTLPTVPRSSYEFVRDWKLLRAHSELRGQYLRQIPPGDYGAIFKQALEESTLVEMLRAAESLPTAEIGSQLRGLSRVQRVDVLVMFMGASDRKLLLSLVDRCEADGQDMSGVKKRVGV